MTDNTTQGHVLPQSARVETFADWDELRKFVGERESFIEVRSGINKQNRRGSMYCQSLASADKFRAMCLREGDYPREWEHLADIESLIVYIQRVAQNDITRVMAKPKEVSHG